MALSPSKRKPPATPIPRGHPTRHCASAALTDDTHRYDTQDSLFDTAWSEAHENQVAVGCGDGSVKLFDISVPQFPVQSWQEHKREVFSVFWNLVAKDTFASSSWDGTIKIVRSPIPQLLHGFSMRECTSCNLSTNTFSGRHIALNRSPLSPPTRAPTPQHSALIHPPSSPPSPQTPTSASSTCAPPPPPQTTSSPQSQSTHPSPTPPTSNPSAPTARPQLSSPPKLSPTTGISTAPTPSPRRASIALSAHST